MKKERLFRIKPLVWKDNNDHSQCNTPCGYLVVWLRGEHWGWAWEPTQDMGGYVWEPCRSLADGKKKAEAAYRARLETALEECE